MTMVMEDSVGNHLKSFNMVFKESSEKTRVIQIRDTTSIKLESTAGYLIYTSFGSYVFLKVKIIITTNEGQTS